MYGVLGNIMSSRLERLVITLKSIITEMSRSMHFVVRGTYQRVEL